MRRVLAFLVWLFSFWTWKDFFFRWLRRSPFHPSGQTVGSSEPLPSQEGPPESELARFLSSLPDERWCREMHIDGDSRVELTFGPNWEQYHADMQAGYCEILGALASSEIVFREELVVRLWDDDSLKHMEAFANAVRQFGSAFTKLYLQCWFVSAIPCAKCLSNMLLGIDVVQDLHLHFSHLNGKMSEEDTTKFMAIIALPHIFQNLKGFSFDAFDYCIDGDCKQFMELFNNPDSVLEKFDVGSILSDDHLQYLSGLLATSTSLKTVFFNKVHSDKMTVFTRGYTSLALALCSNRCLQTLFCELSSSMELKTLLDPLMPKANNLQSNTTLTCMRLWGSVGGKEGIRILTHMLCTNMSLLDFSLCHLHELCSQDVEANENILAILEALKTNKCLKSIGFPICSGVGGHKVLGAMMDLLLENNFIEDIDLRKTPLDESGDAKYVYSELSKRKSVKLWDTVQGMANVKPTSGRVFLCGQPFAGTLCVSRFCT